MFTVELEDSAVARTQVYDYALALVYKIYSGLLYSACWEIARNIKWSHGQIILLSSGTDPEILHGRWLMGWLPIVNYIGARGWLVNNNGHLL